MSRLPTADQVLANALSCLDQAARSLSDARDWLKSDLSGPGYTSGQAARKRDIFTAITAAKAAIDQARHTRRDRDEDCAADCP